MVAVSEALFHLARRTTWDEPAAKEGRNGVGRPSTWRSRIHPREPESGQVHHHCSVVPMAGTSDIGSTTPTFGTSTLALVDRPAARTSKAGLRAAACTTSRDTPA